MQAGKRAGKQALSILQIAFIPFNEFATKTSKCSSSGKSARSKAKVKSFNANSRLNEILLLVFRDQKKKKFAYFDFVPTPS